MIYITIYNFVTGEMTDYSFDNLFDAEEFANNYPATEDEEISIGNDAFGMEYCDYLCFGGRF